MKKKRVLLGMTALASVITLAGCKTIYVTTKTTNNPTSGEVESISGEGSNLDLSESGSISSNINNIEESSSSEEELSNNSSFESLSEEDNIESSSVESLSEESLSEETSNEESISEESLSEETDVESSSSESSIEETYIVNIYNGTTLIQTSTVKKNDIIEEPSQPYKDGYMFKGWYLNSDGSGNPFDFATKINENLDIYAIFVATSNIKVAYAGYNEGMYLEFKDNTCVGTSVYYKKSTDISFIKLDQELVRYDNINGLVRADAVGLEQGNYVFKYITTSGQTYTTDEIKVSAYDRSGYAHFSPSIDSTGVDVAQGVGAYTNKGTLKPNALVVYVTEANKNSVKLTYGGKTYIGLVKILQAKLNVPLSIRFVGTVGCATWKNIEYNHLDPYENNLLIDNTGTRVSKSLNSTSEIVGLGLNTRDTSKYSEIDYITNKLVYDTSKKEYDSYWNMIDVSGNSNITVEGIGADALIDSFGFTFKNCSNYEVRNLTFTRYTEDACSFEGGDKTATSIAGFKTGHVWIHNNTFEEGVNSWDVCKEQDKHDGDGSTDFKGNAFISVSYNHYIKTHKTGLVGGADSHSTACVTFDHNFYDECKSRLPLARQANMHMYNNYYYASTGYSSSIRATGYAFYEACYFDAGKNPIEFKSDGVAKVYNTIFNNVEACGTIVNSREEVVQNQNKFGQTFDTDSSIFYYDSINKKTVVTNMLDVSKVKEYCKTYSGALKRNISSNSNAQEDVSYIVKFVDGSETLKSVRVSQNQTVSKELVSKEGYKLVGYYNDSNFDNEFDFTKGITSDTTIYVKFLKTETYNVKYYDMSTLLYTETVAKDETVMYSPSKPGYSFIDLYIDESLTTPFNRNTKITSDLTLYCKFEEVSDVIDNTYTLDAIQLYKDLSLSSTKTFKEDTTYLDVFTVSKNMRLKSDGLSSAKGESYYHDSTDYDYVIFIDIAEGLTGDLSINIGSTDATRILRLYNVNDMTKEITSGAIGTVSANGLTSGRYVITFTFEKETKIKSITLKTTK